MKLKGAVAKIGALVYPTGVEFVPSSTLFNPDSMASLAGVPLVLSHPDKSVTPENAKDVVVGSILSASPKNDLLEAEIVVYDQDAIEAIKNGVFELSCGYALNLKEKKGDYLGTQYEYVQENRVYNHVALVQRGRAGRKCKLKLDQGEKKLKIITLGSGEKVEIESTELADLINKDVELTQKDHRLSLVELQAKVSKHEVTLGAKEILINELNEEIKNLELKRDNATSSIDVAVLNTIEKCMLFDSGFKPFKTDSSIFSMDEMKSASLVKAGVDVKNKSAAYIEARFDIEIENLKEKHTKEQKTAGVNSNVKTSYVSPRQKFIANQNTEN